jgi:uncharacterized protein
VKTILLISILFTTLIAQATSGRALIDATQKRNIIIVKTLISAGSNVNVQDRGGFTPLMIASMYGYRNIVIILLKSGAKAKIKSRSGHTAMDFAIKNRRKKVVFLLKNHLRLRSR